VAQVVRCLASIRPSVQTPVPPKSKQINYWVPVIYDTFTPAPRVAAEKKLRCDSDRSLLLVYLLVWNLGSEIMPGG
jgi:hypothetical protein